MATTTPAVDSSNASSAHRTASGVDVRGALSMLSTRAVRIAPTAMTQYTAKYGSVAKASAAVTPSATASRNRGRGSERIRIRAKIASGAAAARLKWAVPRATSTGLQANITPAIQDSGTRPVNWYARAKAAYAVQTTMSRYTTLNVATTPSRPSRGSATRFWSAV